MMIDQLIEWDKQVTIALNGLHCSLGDTFFFDYTQIAVWIPLYVALIALFFYKNDWRTGVTLLLLAVATAGLSDFLSSGICKPFFQRLRPSQDPSINMLLHFVNDYRGGLYGFTSSHAANTFSLALFMTLVHRKWAVGVTLVTWAVLNAYSRIYLGVHFVGDIIFGTLIGVGVAFLTYRLYRWTIGRSRGAISHYTSPKQASLVVFVVYVLSCVWCFF